MDRITNRIKLIMLLVLQLTTATALIGQSCAPDFDVTYDCDTEPNKVTISAPTNCVLADYMDIDWGEPSAIETGISITTGFPKSHTYAAPGTYIVNVKLWDDGPDPDELLFDKNMTIVINCDGCCDWTFPISGLPTDVTAGTTTFSAGVGEFYLDQNTGGVVFQAIDCPRTFDYSCLKFEGLSKLNVITTSAITLDESWDYIESEYTNSSFHVPSGLFNGNDFEMGKRGNWRTKQTFAYREDISRDKNHNSGDFGMTVFNWSDPGSSASQWVNTSTVTAYTPNGEPVEERNILNVYSTSKYLQNHTLLSHVAQNAEHNATSFQGFENLYDGTTDYFEDRLVYDNTTAWHPEDGSYPSGIASPVHTGSYSLAIIPEKQVIIGSAKVNAQALSEGLIVRTWIYFDKQMSENEELVEAHLKIGDFDDQTTGTFGATVAFEKVSGAGEWSLYEAYLSPAVLSTLTTAYSGFDEGEDFLWVAIEVAKGALATEEYETGDLYLDDVRIQPLQSEMVCYVYDKVQRLVGMLDDQHYALIYEYNAEGLLVRKIKETTRGIKTISETEYNVKGVDRVN